MKKRLLRVAALLAALYLAGSAAMSAHYTLAANVCGTVSRCPRLGLLAVEIDIVALENELPPEWGGAWEGHTPGGLWGVATPAGDAPAGEWHVIVNVFNPFSTYYDDVIFSADVAAWN